MRAQPPGRSAAEKAFDFLLFPLPLNFVLLVAATIVSTPLESDGESIGFPTVVIRSIQAVGILSLLHWLIGLRKVCQSWHDPLGKVLRFSSVGILLLQASAILEVFGLRQIFRVVTYFTG